MSFTHFKANHLKQIPLLEDIGDDLVDAWLAFFQYLGLSSEAVSRGLQVTDASMLVDAALAGQGVSMLRYSIVYEYIEKGQLVCPFDFIYEHYAYYLIAPERHFHKPKVQCFEKWLREEMQIIENSLQKLQLTHQGT